MSHDDTFEKALAEPDTSVRTVPPTSILAGLKAKREAVRAGLHLDLSVPEWDDQLGIDLFVRYRPFESRVTTKLAEVASKSKNPERIVNANASALASACEGIFYLADGVEKAFDKEDEDGVWPVFEARVAETIGVSFVSPSHLVRDLYFTDDQLNAAASKVQEWSQGEIRERAKDDAGN